MFSDHQSLVFLGAKNGFFSLDLLSNEMHSNNALNTFIIKDLNDSTFLKTFFAQDDFGRLLINVARLNPDQKTVPPSNNELVVLHNLDSIINYNHLISQPGIVTQNLHFQTEKKFFGSDFTRSINWVTGDGLVFCELKANHQIISLPHHTGIRAIAPLSDNTLFVNTDIFPQELNLSTRTWIPFYSSENDIKENGLSPLIVKDNKVWGSLMQGGLFAMDQKMKEYTLKPIDQVFDKFVFMDGDSILFFTRDGGLFTANIHTGFSTPVKLKNKPFTVNSFVNEMVVTDDGEVVAATRNGLWMINLNLSDAFHIPDLGGFSGVNLLSITQSKSDPNELWLGSANHGVIVYNTQSRKSFSISEKDDLSNNAVVGILEDETRNKWVATFHGINIIAENNKVIYTLEASDGLTNDEYNRVAYAKLPDGRFVFGSINGLDILDPQTILNSIKSSVPLNLFLNSISYYSEDQDSIMVLNGKNRFIEPIEISAENKYISADFALSEYANIDDHSFQYRLISGAEKTEPWIDIGSISELYLSNLPVGEYVVEIRGADHHAQSAASIIQIPILVRDFFYKSWQFYVLVVSLVSLAVFFFYMRLLREKQKLNGLMIQRTAKIEKDKVLIQEQSEKIKNLYDLTTKNI